MTHVDTAEQSWQSFPPSSCLFSSISRTGNPAGPSSLCSQSCAPCEHQGFNTSLQPLQGPGGVLLAGGDFCCKNNLFPCAAWSLIPSRRMDPWEWAAVCMNGPLGCKSYTCAGGIGVGNDMKQSKTGGVQERLVANLVVNCYFFSCKSPSCYQITCN